MCWHISLSTFLRDYLYIPLGGNRKGSRRTYVNLVVVMLLGGLWHGANWTFVAWGAYHGVLLAFERFLGKVSPIQQWPRPVRVAATFAWVLISWVLFRSANLHEAINYLAAMIGHGASGPRQAAHAGASVHAGDAPDHGRRGVDRRLANPGTRLEQGRHLGQGDSGASAVLRIALNDVFAIFQSVPLLPVLGYSPCQCTVVRTSWRPLFFSPWSRRRG